MFLHSFFSNKSSSKKWRFWLDGKIAVFTTLTWFWLKFCPNLCALHNTTLWINEWRWKKLDSNSVLKKNSFSIVEFDLIALGLNLIWLDLVFDQIFILSFDAVHHKAISMVWRENPCRGKRMGAVKESWYWENHDAMKVENLLNT